MSEMSEKLIALFGHNDDIRDAGLRVPQDLTIQKDLRYGNDPMQVFDLYYPPHQENLPVIISVHGGGWVYGDKERYQYYGMHLAQKGFAVVNFSYRLAPLHKFPAPIEDLNAVCHELYKYEVLDLQSVFAVGDSAGAQALGIYTNMLTNPDYAKHFHFTPPQDFMFQGIALNCGQYQVTLDNEMTTALMQDYLPHGGNESELNLIDVTAHVNSHWPSVFVMTAAKDFLKDQAVLLTNALTAKDVPFVYRYYAGDLAHVFHLDIRNRQAQLCNEEETHFFKEMIQDGTVL